MSRDDLFSGECQCQYCKDQRFGETVASGVGGIRAASWAASFGYWTGIVREGSMFARFKSMAMKGALSPGTAQGIRAVFQLMYVGGAAAENLCKTDRNGNPIVPETAEEWDNWVNRAIELGYICGGCKKRIDSKLRGRCRSVCACSLYRGCY